MPNLVASAPQNALDNLYMSLKELEHAFNLRAPTLPAFAAHLGKALAALSPSAQNLALYVALVVGSYVVAVASQNYSQVDKLWSITPALFVWIWTLQSGGDQRLTLMAIAVSVWAIRLTLNFARRGGYSFPKFWQGEEDYRWVMVQRYFQADKHPILWQFVHFFIIDGYQHGLLLAITLPAQLVFANRGATNPVGFIDYAATLIILGLVMLEAKADNDQYDFQEYKYSLINLGIDKSKLPLPYGHGFLHTGVWALSRHPNYFAEQAIWVALNLYVYSATGLFFTWVLAGSIALIMLFQVSIQIQERTTAAKWPLYKQYQNEVPMLLPYGRKSMQTGKLAKVFEYDSDKDE